MDGSIDVVEQIIKNLYEAVPEKSRIMIKVQRASFYKDRKIEPDDIRSVCSLLNRYPEISRVTVPVNSGQDVSGTCLSR